MSTTKNILLSKILSFLYGIEAKIRANALEYHLKQSALDHPLGLKENQTSDIIRFLQSGLRDIGYDTGTTDGIFSPRLMEAVNLFVPLKQSESVDLTEYVEGGHKALRPISCLQDITANHIAAIADSLNDSGKMSFDKPSTLKQYCAALKEIPDETIASIVRDLEKELEKTT